MRHWVKRAVALTGLLVIGIGGSAYPQEGTNTLRGKVVDLDSQGSLDEVAVTFRNANSGNVLANLKSKDGGRYEARINPANNFLTITYSKEGYVQDSRKDVRNSVRDKELDTWAIESHSNAVKSEARLSSALLRLLTYVQVSKDILGAQKTSEAFKAGNPALYEAVLNKNARLVAELRRERIM